LGVVLPASAVVIALDAPATDLDEALLTGEGLTLDAKADDERLVLLALRTIFEQTNWQILGIRNLVITPGEGLTVEVVVENEDTKERLIRSGEYDRATNQWTDRIISESKADEALDLDQWRIDKTRGKGGKRKPRTEKPKCNKGQSCGMSCIRRKSASGKDVQCRFKPEGAAEEALQSVTGGGRSGGQASPRTPTLTDFTYHTSPTKTVFNDLRDAWQDDYKDNFWSDDKNKSNQIKVTQRILAEPNKDGRLREIRDSAGNLQAAAIITPSINRIRSPNDHLHVDWLATAPWNLPDSTDPRKVSGAGSAMIREIIQEAKTNLDKYPGGVQLESLQAAVPFYKKLGFDVQTELNNVSYMVLSADKIRGMG
jgi:hypothetical protein